MLATWSRQLAAYCPQYRVCSACFLHVLYVPLVLSAADYCLVRKGFQFAQDGGEKFSNPSDEYALRAVLPYTARLYRLTVSVFLLPRHTKTHCLLADRHNLPPCPSVCCVVRHTADHHNSKGSKHHRLVSYRCIRRSYPRHCERSGPDRSAAMRRQLIPLRSSL
jgi:hypothetical protein